MTTLYQANFAMFKNRLFRIIMACFCFFLTSKNLDAATLYSRTNGDWSTGTTWSTTGHTGNSCNCTPGNKDWAVINHVVTFSTNLNVGIGGYPDSILVKSGASLTGNGSSDLHIRTSGLVRILGTMEIRDLIMYNGGFLFISTSGVLTITNDFFARNSTQQMVVDGYIDVKGDFDAGNSADIAGAGYMTVIQTSTFSGTGLAFGCQLNCCPSGVNCRFPALASPLPVSWLGVQLKENADGIHIFWQTASEENNSHFTIERSVNGFVFTPIGSRPGGGTKLVKSEYSFVDPTPPAGKVYYRIKQTDFNGKFDYSATATLRRSAANYTDLRISPNPWTMGQNLMCTLESGSAGEIATVSVFNSTGTVCLNYTATISENKQIMIPSASLLELASGMYTVRVQTPATITSTWLFVSR